MVTQTYTALSAVTSTTVSSVIPVADAEEIVAEFIAASVTSGNGVFTVDGSIDNSNWVTGIAFLDAAATAVTTFVTSKTLNSTSNAGAYIPAGWKFLRFKCAVTTDGSYSVIVQVRSKSPLS
jgi:hypothetical protein